MKFEANKVGLFTGICLAVCHAVWSIMVAVGFAKLYLNWIFGLHFLKNPFMVTKFGLPKALLLIVFTFIVGYVGGYFFTLLWNRMVKK
jgi:amino acid transporter